jgi:hypothetical protein
MLAAKLTATIRFGLVETGERRSDLCLQTRDRPEDTLESRVAEVGERLPLVLAHLTDA